MIHNKNRFPKVWPHNEHLVQILLWLNIKQQRGENTFWVAVLSSAKQVAKFFAHWPSCIAAA